MLFYKSSINYYKKIEDLLLRDESQLCYFTN